jgi:hypothetical protein
MPVVGYIGNYGLGSAGATKGNENMRVQVLKGLAETGYI